MLVRKGEGREGGLPARRVSETALRGRREAKDARWVVSRTGNEIIGVRVWVARRTVVARNMIASGCG